MYSLDQIVDDADLRRLMHRFYEVESVILLGKPVRLSSTIESRIYVSGRNDFTLHTDVIAHVGRLVGKAMCEARLPGEKRQLCLIGIPTAGTPLALAASLMSYGVIASCQMRETKKTYGRHQMWVEGEPCDEEYIYGSIENVVTSGDSLLARLDRLREDGYPVHEMLHLVLVDRELGGMNIIRSQGYRVEALFTISTIVNAFVHFELWTEAQAEVLWEELRSPR